MMTEGEKEKVRQFNRAHPAMARTYESTVEKLLERVWRLGPSVLTIDSPWDLYKLGLKTNDLDVTLAMADACLSIAQRWHRDGHTPTFISPIPEVRRGIMFEE